MARVLIVDDDKKFVPLLERGLRFEGFEVETAATGKEAIDRAPVVMPDIVVLDIGMPGLDGFEVLRRLRVGSDVPVVMLTARDEVADKIAALGLGADDYVAKPFAFDELVARIRALLRRRGAISEEKLTFADLSCDLWTREVVRGGRSIELTATEFDLLVHLLKHPRHVQTREGLLRSVWGYDRLVETNVVDVHVGRIRRKLGDPHLIQTVRSVGYILKEEEQ
jgi:two-component system response regulator MprA